MEFRRLTFDECRLAHAAVNELTSEAVAEEAVAAFLKHDDHVLLVAFEEDEPVGFLVAYRLQRLRVTQPMMLLYDVQVDVEHRRLGVARGGRIAAARPAAVFGGGVSSSSPDAAPAAIGWLWP